jgi:hypothetical protein
MPSPVARRNCNATISPSPLQGVAPNATQLARGSSSHWDRTLAAPYRGHASSASPALTRSEPLSQAQGRSRRRGCTYKSLAARTSNGRHGVPRSANLPSNKPNEPAGLHTSSPRWKAPTPLLFALGAAMLLLTFVIETAATAFGRRCMHQCQLGESMCTL